MRTLVALSFLTVAACGGGGSGGTTTTPPPPPPPPDPTALSAANMSFGAATGALVGSNGLAFADAASVLADIEGAGVMNIKLVRALTDWETGETRFVISNETVDVVDIGGGDFERDMPKSW